jgi:hypothetical protein
MLTRLLPLPLLLIAPSLSADAPSLFPAAPVEDAAHTQQQRWLDEVRAQREAWEARRNAAKQASDARLRQLDPWGAARLEQLERHNQARRDALQERADTYREQLQAQEQALEAWRRQITPYGWDNRWYYQGY